MIPQDPQSDQNVEREIFINQIGNKTFPPDDAAIKLGTAGEDRFCWPRTWDQWTRRYWLTPHSHLTSSRDPPKKTTFSSPNNTRGSAARVCYEICLWRNRKGTSACLSLRCERQADFILLLVLSVLSVLAGWWGAGAGTYVPSAWSEWEKSVISRHHSTARATKLATKEHSSASATVL